MVSKLGSADRTLALPRFALAVLAAAWAIGVTPAQAADHAEAPLTRADAAADIADVYAWHDAGARTLTTILTFDGFKSPRMRNTTMSSLGTEGSSRKKEHSKKQSKKQRGTFVPGVLYTINIDNNGDFDPDIQIYTRFAQDRRGRWGLMVENLPGAHKAVIGPVEKKIDAGRRARVFAGYVDDPFFFDLEGFRATLATATLSFNGDRDTFAGTNATAIVLEMDLDAALGGGSALNIWATTARDGGTP